MSKNGLEMSLKMSQSSAHTEDNESDDSSLSESFKSLVKHHKKPYYHEYDKFATSYLCRDIPFPRIFCDGENPARDIPIPFKNPILLEKYSVPEKVRLDLGESIRRKKIVPKSTQVILDEIAVANKEFQDQNQRTTFLFLKAKEWCELNKALVMDNKYPKPDPNTIRRKYSETHQKVMKDVREQLGLSSKTPIFPSVPSSAPYTVSGEQKKHTGTKVSTEPVSVVAARVSKPKEKSPEKILLEKLFEDIKPIPGLMRRKQPWQFAAAKSLTVVPKAKKKSHFKKNVYPPKSREEIIAEMRKKLPPLKPDHLQTDYLSGIWDPALMSEKFEISAKNYDSRIIVDTNLTGAETVSWYDMCKAKEKCSKWLKSIPDSL